MKRLSIALLCCLLISRSFAQTGLYVPDLAVFDTQMLNILSTHHVPGGQLAITYKGRLVYNRGFGYADTTTGKLVQPNSIFRVASVSKSITAATIMHLVENNALNLSDTVFGTAGILNELIYLSAIDPRYYSITVRQLLSHSAGFAFAYPTDPLFKTYDIALAMGVPPPTDSIELILQWTLQNKMLNYTPGTSSNYTNFAYAVLGKIIEKKTGKKYTAYVRDSILRPLNITQMYAGRNLLVDTMPNEVTYYDYSGAPLRTSIYTGIPASVPATYGLYNYSAMTPAGGWVASAKDLCRFLVAIDRYTTKPDFWNPITIDTMLKTYSTWPAYGHGWYVSGADYYHTGGIEGSASVIKITDAHELNWAVLFNGLPSSYGPFYADFMNIVTDHLSAISTWPGHDLFDVPTSISNSETGISFTVSPNPSPGVFSIKANSDILHIGVHNLLGQKVAFFDAVKSKQKGIDISYLPGGLYLLNVTFETGNSLFQRIEIE